jgi:N-hydroxyarylamine O-acetyltransferase
MTSDLPALSAATRRAYLERLGVTAPRIDLVGLCELQAAHLRALPFHNLQLLAADGADPDPPSIAVAVEGVLRGLGGTCHLLTPPFMTLLRALGFDAWLAAATVGVAGDHLVGVVRAGGALHLCDVGNGHPYLRPFSLGEEADTASAYGWTFMLEPWSADGATHRLRRRLPDGAWKTVYTVDPRPVEHSSFAAIIRGHHTRAGFGPFLTGLRAVRVGANTLWTLRDQMLERFHVSGRIYGRREIADDAAIGRVLTHCFGLAELPWAAALEVWRRRARPAVATPEEPPLRVLFAVGVTDRPGGLRRLGSGLLRARSRARWAEDSVGVLAVDNGCAPGSLAEEAAALRAEGCPRGSYRTRSRRAGRPGCSPRGSSRTSLEWAGGRSPRCATCRSRRSGSTSAGRRGPRDSRARMGRWRCGWSTTISRRGTSSAASTACSRDQRTTCCSRPRGCGQSTRRRRC